MPEYAIDGGHAYTPSVEFGGLCRVCGAGKRDVGHRHSLRERLCEAIETAIASEDGLDAAAGEALLREAGYWPGSLPPRPQGGR